MPSQDNQPKALIVLCHPNKTGFNQAIAAAAVSTLSQTHIVDFVNLYDEGFDPVLPAPELPRKFTFDETVQRYNALVKAADILVFVHPDWWGGPPALLKGFIDRVFRPGVAYEFEGFDLLAKKKSGLLEGKKALVFTTTDYPEPTGIDPSAALWKDRIFGYCGIDDARVHTFFDTYHSTYEARHQWIEQVPARIKAALAR